MSKELTTMAEQLPADSPVRQQIVLAQIMAKSKMVPSHFFQKPEDLLVAFMAGEPLGLKPFQAAQSFAVINGSPTLYGDSLIAVCQTDPHYEWHKVDYDAKTKTAKATVKRKNADPTEYFYSYQSVERAGLASRPNWQKHPIKMLMNRALAHLMRMQFPAALRGIQSAEEMEDHVYSSTGKEPMKAAEIITESLPATDWEAKIGESQSLEELLTIGDEMSKSGLEATYRSALINVYNDKRKQFEEKK